MMDWILQKICKWVGHNYVGGRSWKADLLHLDPDLFYCKRCNFLKNTDITPPWLWNLPSTMGPVWDEEDCPKEKLGDFDREEMIF